MSESQRVEVLGRNLLVTELLRDGLEVAMPLRDRGIDLIAYLDLEVENFLACPIQMKAASSRTFSIDAKYARFPNLLLVHVWHVAGDETPVFYAMSYAEALDVAAAKGWTMTSSWTDRGYYANNQPGAELVSLLERHRMTRGRWATKIRELGTPLAK